MSASSNGLSASTAAIGATRRITRCGIREVAMAGEGRLVACRAGVGGRRKAPRFRPEDGAKAIPVLLWITRERLARPFAPKTTRGAVTGSKKSSGGGSSFDEGPRPSHGPRCDHQYDRGCEHQTQQTE